MTKHLGMIKVFRLKEILIRKPPRSFAAFKCLGMKYLILVIYLRISVHRKCEYLNAPCPVTSFKKIDTILFR